MKLRRRPDVVPKDATRAIAVKVEEGFGGLRLSVMEPQVTTEWDVERVKKLFGHCEFPTEGVVTRAMLMGSNDTKSWNLVLLRVYALLVY